jgi:hypothetical protein
MEMKRAEDYAKDSDIASVARSKGMAFSRGYGFCNFGAMPEEQRRLEQGMFPSIEAQARCDGVKLQRVRGRKGRKKGSVKRSGTEN